MATSLLSRNMRLFGLPYQFMDSVDPRIPTVSPVIGRRFAENLVLDAPVISIIPGKPDYLPAKSEEERNVISSALVNAASGKLGPLKNMNHNDVYRYYDFKEDYTEYMTYVNILCRSCASFLEIEEMIDGEAPQRYDYRKYKWNTNSSSGFTENVVTSLANALSAGFNSIKESINVSYSDTESNTNKQSTVMQYETTTGDADENSIEDFLRNNRYVQFFIDTDASANESMSNATSESKLKGMLDAGSDLFKEVSFIAQSGGMDSAAMAQFLDESIEAIDKNVTKDTNAISGVLSRVLSLASNVAKGENIIMPDVYQNSAYEKSYTFTVHLKCPYGTKFGYFMDICVPLMHLLCLGLPRQTTNANTYASPFLVKAYCDGIFTCNLGMVTSIQVTKGVNNAYSVDGLPTEVDVSVTITDLYSDLSLSPQSAPVLFVTNSSLIEYLATTCGLSLVSPNIEAKYKMIITTFTNAIADIDNNIISGITEAIDTFVSDFLGLTR